MPSSHLILCRPLLLLPPIPPSIRVFSNESTLCMRWPKYCSFSFSIIPSKEHPGLISFRMDWLDLLAVQGTLRSLLQHHSSKASVLWCWSWNAKQSILSPQGTTRNLAESRTVTGYELARTPQLYNYRKLDLNFVNNQVSWGEDHGSRKEAMWLTPGCVPNETQWKTQPRQPWLLDPWKLGGVF